jgi:hypothetical protein
LKRISQIEKPKDFALEREREALRDRRWKRRRNMILVALVCVVVIDGFFFDSRISSQAIAKVLLSAGRLR